MEEAAALSGTDLGMIRSLMARGELPRYVLGQGLIRTRLGTAVQAVGRDPVDVRTAARHLAGERKWIYNHLGELSHGVLGATKSFLIAELDWYLDTRRMRPRSS